MKLGLFSDTHTYHKYLQIKEEDNIDVLICCGDFTSTGKKYEVDDFIGWFKEQPSKYKILIAGNHEITFDSNKLLYGDVWVKDAIANFTSNPNNYYLENSCIEIDNVKFFGSPITPWFYGDRWAFNQHRGNPIKQVWELIPLDTDVVITHGPPKGILDWVKYTGEHVGCKDLLNKIYEVKPKVCTFGHIHYDHGLKYDSNIEIRDNVTFINASICNDRYDPVNPLTIIEI